MKEKFPAKKEKSKGASKHEDWSGGKEIKNFILLPLTILTSLLETFSFWS